MSKPNFLDDDDLIIAPNEASGKHPAQNPDRFTPAPPDMPRLIVKGRLNLSAGHKPVLLKLPVGIAKRIEAECAAPTSTAIVALVKYALDSLEGKVERIDASTIS